MSVRNDFWEEFGSSLAAVPLPERIASLYRLENCLSRPGDNEAEPERSVWLIRRKADDAPFLLKTDRAAGSLLPEEFDLMGRLPADLSGQVPAPVDCFREEGVWYLIRTYLPGKTLAESPDAPCGETGEALCALLERLHGLDPPIIHRDIKPENIVISPTGRPGLIDFGVARSYKPDQETDTVMMGTRSTAAPEQYGFSQSDQRTDLYALGVTLRWLVTGSYDPEDLKNAPCSRRLKRCLRKAAAFSPEDRYPSAAALRKALHRASQPLWPRLIPIFLAAALAIWTLAALVTAPRGVRFTSPLLESAVRAELDIPEGPVTAEDLAEVRRLALVGSTLLGEEQSYDYRVWSYVDGAEHSRDSGGVKDLSVLAKMPNLEVLYLCHQDITDLTPLTGLPLKELYLCGNEIKDLTPLGDMKTLEVLYLADNPAADFSPLARLNGLRELNMDETAPNNLDFLAGMYVQVLSMGQVRPRDGDWSCLAAAPAVWKLMLWDPPEEAVEVLTDMPLLDHLRLCAYRGEDLRSLKLPDLATLNVIGGEMDLAGLEQMTGLQNLDFCNLGDIDLRVLEEFPLLRWFSVYNCPISDYSPLARVESLVWVCLDQAATEVFAATCPEYGFELLQS